MTRFQNQFIGFRRVWQGRLGACVVVSISTVVLAAWMDTRIATGQEPTDNTVSGASGQAAEPDETPAPTGGLMDLLPSGPELGAGWERQLDLLIDSRSSPGEYFPPETPPESRASLRTRTSGKAHAQARYTREDFGTFEALLTRHDREEDASAQWQALKDARPPLTGSSINIRSARIGETEAVVHEGAPASTVWLRSGPHVLALIVAKPGGVPEEFLKVAEVFLRKLAASSAQGQVEVDAVGANRGTESGSGGRGKRVVHTIGDLYVAVEEEIPRRVHLSAPRYHGAEGLYYFAITNTGDTPIVLWNVRVQVPVTGPAPDADDGWKTIRSSYPSCVSGIRPGTVGKECVSPPESERWRACFIYTRQTDLGESDGSVPVKAIGEYELISEPIERNPD